MSPNNQNNLDVIFLDLFQERPGFLMPWIVFQVIAIVLSLFRLVGSIALFVFTAFWIWVTITITITITP